MVNLVTVEFHDFSKAFNNRTAFTIKRSLWRRASSLKCKRNLKLIKQMMGGSTYSKCCTFSQNWFSIYCSLKVNWKTWQLFDQEAKSIHFHLFIFINVVTTFVILHVYQILSDISLCNIMLLTNWQGNYIHTYQIWFQLFHFPIAR